MTSETPNHGEMTWPASDLEVSSREVARLANCGPRGRWDDAVDAAIARARSLAAPRARWLRVDHSHDLDGLFPSDTPVAAIFARGDERWAFVITIGAALETEVQALFDRAEFLDAVLLDAAGSAMAEAGCDRLQATLCPTGTSERYSPGYCAWSMQGQRKMFALLEPERLNIELLDTMLMQPLKSVTGVVVSASAAALRVEATVCAGCDARGCTRRQAKYSR